MPVNLTDVALDDNFVLTPFVEDLATRALSYLRAGFPVHFRGPSGTGKTALAAHVAARIGRPVLFLSGDDEFSTSDLVGAYTGLRRKKIVDRFIHSVLKMEDETIQTWVDNPLTTACRNGYTLIYDEFTRSRPEANNVLLSVLEERLLALPASRRGDGHVRVHPDFTALFTSNPEEYAGIHKTQDALRDRMITLDLNYLDEETETAITGSKSGLDALSSRKIVRLVRAVRESEDCRHTPTVRACIMIARVVRQNSLETDYQDSGFYQVCDDVLTSTLTNGSGFGQQLKLQRLALRKLIATEVREDREDPGIMPELALTA
ncbi:MAG: gas vesicle protein GvpN [Armatimonadetes bacterium]|nr:gas vesicle protein GvpN [Armatimonadota bacterium]